MMYLKASKLGNSTSLVTHWLLQDIQENLWRGCCMFIFRLKEGKHCGPPVTNRLAAASERAHCQFNTNIPQNDLIS